MPRPGDAVACHSPGVIGWAIRFGEWIRFRPGDQWNHFAVVDHKLPTGDYQVIEAVSRGVVTARLSEIAVGGRYEIVSPPIGTRRTDVVAFARSQLGSSYGWLSILSIILSIILPRWLPLPSLRMERTWICSALYGESARAGGWLCSWPDIYRVVPSELYAALTNTEQGGLHPMNALKSIAKKAVAKIEQAGHAYFVHASGQALAWYTVATHDLSKWESGVTVVGTAVVTAAVNKLRSFGASAA